MPTYAQMSDFIYEQGRPETDRRLRRILVLTGVGSVLFWGGLGWGAWKIAEALVT